VQRGQRRLALIDRTSHFSILARRPGLICPPPRFKLTPERCKWGMVGGEILANYSQEGWGLTQTSVGLPAREGSGDITSEQTASSPRLLSEKRKYSPSNLGCSECERSPERLLRTRRGGRNIGRDRQGREVVRLQESVRRRDFLLIEVAPLGQPPTQILAVLIDASLQ
jgi:hypothetical protein